MDGNSRVSKINLILIVIVIVSAIMAIIIINLPKLRAQIETTIKNSETIENSYTGETTNQVDISKNGDGSVIATLAYDGTLTISGSGEIKDFSASNSIKDICNSTKIKKVIIESGVTNIGNYMFMKCYSLTDITIPKSVTSIGENAFNVCSGLTTLNIPEGVTSIGMSAFSGCNSLTAINIPEGVTSIGSYAFSGCTGLTSIKIPEGVTSIESGTFYGCSSLTSINIPESVTVIEEAIFSYCSSLTEIKVDENNTKYIDDNGVLYTKDKTQIIKYPPKREGRKYTILDGVINIKNDTFYNCNNLISVNIPEGVTIIGDSAFYNCDNLTSITMPEGLISIGNEAFYGCSSLTSISIPNGVTNIGYSIVEGCSNLTSINIPESVTSIGSSAFSGCSSLTEINVDDSNTNYMDDEGVLYTKDKTNLIKYPQAKEGAEYTILEGVISIGNEAFYRCRDLTVINIPEGVTSIGNSAFSYCSSLTRMIIPEGLVSIGDRAFWDCNSLIDINIPGSVTDIGNEVFWNTQILQVIDSDKTNLPDILGRVLIEGDVLYSTKDFELTNCIIEEGQIILNDPNNIAKIEVVGGSLARMQYIFVNKFDVSKNRDGSIIATLNEDGILTISGNGFTKDYKGNLRRPWNELEGRIKKVEISKGITFIGNDIFNGCSNLTEINVDENNTRYKDYNGILYTKDNTQIIKYPPKREETEYTILEGVTSIADDTFYGSTNLISINVPESITSIGEYAFAYCSNLTSINIPEGVTSIGQMAFYDCSSLTGLKIPPNLTSLKYGIFGNCESLISINIPEGVTSIGMSAFNGCNSLTSINIPNSVTSIESSTFSYCSSLISVNIPDSVTSIGGSAFSYCSSLTSIRIPKGVTSIGKMAFDNCSSLTEIKVDENNTKYSDVAGVLYSKQKAVIIKYPENKEGNEYTILGDVKKIEENAFAYCSNLTSINIPEGVTSIGEYAFRNCSNLISINIPSSVLNLERGTFYLCSRLKNVNISEGLKSIGRGVFEECTSLIKVNIPSTTTTIEQYAFRKCNLLTEVTIPVEVKEIDKTAFVSNNKLTIWCCIGSVAETYAKDNNIDYQIDNEIPTINFSIKGTSIPVKEEVVNVTVEDRITGVIGECIKYIWSTNDENVTKEQIVNSFQNGETLGIKDVTGTYYLWIYAKDKVGNESIMRSEQFILDNTPPIVETSYSTTEPTKENITVTITANEEMQNVDGWTLSDDKKVLTKEYSENTTETITIKDILENEIQKEVKISNIDRTPPETETSYNITNATNQNVIVTISSDEKMQEVEGWTLSEDRKVLTKEYSENTTETITVNDIVGNETQVEIAISNIDKVAPEAEVNYSTTEVTNQNVTVTITATEEVQAIEGWTLSEDKKELIKKYAQNTTETVTVKDIAGNEIQVQVVITNIKDEIAPEAEVTYSIAEVTNQNVVVTITANEAVQSVEGWTLSEDKKVLTKEYSQNTTELVTVKDLVGNETQVQVEISNIDRTAPIVRVNYTEQTNENIKVTITVNEEVQTIEGWTLSTDKKVLTKEYSENTTETVTIKDIAGNETQVEIKVTQVKGIFKENTYEIKDSYITKIKPNTTYEDFIKNIQTTRQYKITENNKEVTGKTLIKTGQKFVINNKTYTLVVTGDINGDGKTNIVDLSRLKLAIVGKVNLEGEYKEATDVNSNGQPLQITDLSKMKLYIVGKTNL